MNLRRWSALALVLALGALGTAVGGSPAGGERPRSAAGGSTRRSDASVGAHAANGHGEDEHAAHASDATPSIAMSAHPGVRAAAASARPRAIRVSVTGPVRSVTAALAEARAGDTIIVSGGVYREPTLVIARPVTLLGERGAVLDGEGKRAILLVRADNVTVRGLTFRDVGVSYMEDRAALKVEGARGCVVQDNRIEDAFFGIYLARSTGCRIVGNELVATGRSESGSGNGIHLWYSRDVQVANNRIRGHRDGIYLEFSQDIEATGNVSEGNLRYGLHFMFSHGGRYFRNIFRDNGAGVAVMYTHGVDMEGNLFEHNRGASAYGLLLKSITDSRIVANVFRQNTVALYAEASNRLDVRGNEFRGNGWAVRILADCEADRFTGNDFVANSFDVATNSRSNASTFDGNYWDAYRGYDLDRDGMGDVPHHPVRLFSLLAAENEPALVLLRSPFVQLLDTAERVLPVLTPETLVDRRPAMHPFAGRSS